MRNSISRSGPIKCHWNYLRSHGYCGPSGIPWKVRESPWDARYIRDRLKTRPVYGLLHTAVVTETSVAGTVKMMVDGSNGCCRWRGMHWARPFRSDTQQGPTRKGDGRGAGGATAFSAPNG
ncbi:MAG: hypothetical protein GPOALKHO_001178 [Sodalis sp.]|uniref:hypothetical protein n=1 Tax=Sodalis sp. (in: enterobacteria) TaxID=1898979 RepID=UPI00387399B9|nr:MAG: hypothetical protein GPOALKHO_001178 [Sodalis sp.]